MCSSVSIGYFLLTGSAKGTSPYWLSPSFGVTSLRAGIAMSAPLEPFAALNADEIELTVEVLGKRVPALARSREDRVPLRRLAVAPLAHRRFRPHPHLGALVRCDLVPAACRDDEVHHAAS